MNVPQVGVLFPVFVVDLTPGVVDTGPEKGWMTACRDNAARHDGSPLYASRATGELVIVDLHDPPLGKAWDVVPTLNELDYFHLDGRSSCRNRGVVQRPPRDESVVSAAEKVLIQAHPSHQDRRARVDLLNLEQYIRVVHYHDVVCLGLGRRDDGRGEGGGGVSTRSPVDSPAHTDDDAAQGVTRPGGSHGDCCYPIRICAVRSVLVD